MCDSEMAKCEGGKIEERTERFRLEREKVM